MATQATNALYNMLTTLTNSIASLVGSMTGMVPLINQAITASATASKASEELNDTLKEAQKTKSKLAFNPPEKFDGTPENTVPFTQSCTFYFGAKREEDTQQCVTFALSKIKGGTNNMATVWANQQRAAILEKPDLYASWEAFTTALHTHFQLQDDSAEAIFKIRTLEMG